jgi:hypothetical protein
MIECIVLTIEQADPEDSVAIVCAPWLELIPGNREGDRR